MLEELKNIMQFAYDNGYFENNDIISASDMMLFLDTLEKTLNRLNNLIKLGK